MKKTTTINIELPIWDFLDREAQRLSISRNDLIEVYTILKIAEQQPASLNVADFVRCFPLKKRGNASPAFRSAILELTPQDAWTLVVFFSSLNLIPDMEVSIHRLSNLWKRGELISYFAYGQQIARQNIQDLIDKQNQLNNVAQMTNQSSSNGNSFYFSCLQQLKHPQCYPHWTTFLNILELPSNTTIIRVDGFALLHTILPALKKL